MPRAKPMSKTKKSHSIRESIKPIEKQVDNFMKLALYGRGGTGKTTLYSTFPGKILSILCSPEGELKSLDIDKMKGKMHVINLLRERREHKKQELEFSVAQRFYELIEYLEDNPKEYSTVAIDHCTGFQEMILADLLDEENIPQQLSWGKATQNQYGQMTLQFKELLRPLIDLDCNVVLVSQEREFNIEQSNDLIDPYIGPAVSPSSCTWLEYNCDCVYQTFIRNKVEKVETIINKKKKIKTRTTDELEYCLRVVTDSVHRIKSRDSNKKQKQKIIINPTYEKIKK